MSINIEEWLVKDRAETVIFNHLTEAAEGNAHPVNVLVNALSDAGLLAPEPTEADAPKHPTSKLTFIAHTDGDELKINREWSDETGSPTFGPTLIIGLAALIIDESAESGTDPQPAWDALHRQVSEAMTWMDK